MTRVPPFSTTPTRSRNLGPVPPSSYSQDSRPSSLVSDGTTAGMSVYGGINGGSGGPGLPSRPSRSDLRRIPSSTNSELRGGGGMQPPPRSAARALAVGNRDSIGTSYSDREVPAAAVSYSSRRPIRGSERDRVVERERDMDRRQYSEPETSSRSAARNRPSMDRDARSPVSPDESTSPKALQAVVAALQGAGARRAKRQATLDGGMSPGSALSPGSAGFGSSPGGFGSSQGGFGSYEEMEREEIDRRRREQARADAQRRERMAARQMNGTGKPRARGDIDSVLDQIQGEWEWVAKPDFNAIELAVALLDDSSVGKDMESFNRTKRMLERALKGTIETYAQTFAAALPHHAMVVSSLNTSREQLAETKTKLTETKESLGSRRADLAQLWTRGQTLDEMIKIIDEIEYIKSVPDTLESLISEKKLLQASSLLLRSTKIISKSEMQEIGALGDLRAYLTGQESTLREILLDELQAHMYLKTFWCDTRWQSYTSGQQMLPKVEFDDEKSSRLAPADPRSKSSHLSSYLQELNLKQNDSPYDPSANTRASIATLTTTDPSAPQTNPETDSFTYLETILESLAILGKLGSGIESITQRLPMELYSIVETTIDEVNERSEFSKRLPGFMNNAADIVAAKTATAYMYVDPKRPVGSAPAPSGTTTAGVGATDKPAASLLRLSALENSAANPDHEILRDLFWTLYSKLDAVSQSMRVVYEVANRIGSRKDFRDSLGAKSGAIFPFPELWEPLDAELRGLIMLYLTVEKGGASTGKTQIPSINEVLQTGKVTRDKGWQSFRFGDSDSKQANRFNKTHEEELTRVLKDSVPGLVGGAETSVHTALVTAVDDRFASAVPHRLLVTPDAFHVSVVFHPTLAFLDRAAEVLPSTTSERIRQSSSFLDEFVLRVYLPQLEDKVADLFIKTVNSPDAFLPDPYWKRLASRPLVKATTELMSLVNSLCAMQQTTPFHRDNYSRLILGVIIQFYQRCSDRFRELVSTREGGAPDEGHVAVAARWAQKLEVAACVSALYALPEDDVAGSRRICRQETRVELNFLTTETVARDDLVPSKNLHALGNLFHSLIWLMRQLLTMRAVVEDPLSPNGDFTMGSEAGFTAVTPHFPLLPPAPPTDDLKLPLTKPMALRFDALMRTYEQLAEYVLATLRIDTRCRTIHFLDLAMRRGNYRVDRDAGDPDPHIVDLNLDLGVCDDCANETLPPKERKFLFDGLGTLMEHLLISNGRHIRFANAVGIQKIMRNMLAMQQNMKTITDASQDADFERAKIYYNLFSMTPREMLNSIRRRPQFTLEEYKTMLNFQCGVDQALGERGIMDATMDATDRSYQSYVTELHALAIEDSTD